MTIQPTLISRAGAFAERIALSDRHGRYTYGELIEASTRSAGGLLNQRPDLSGARIAFLVPPSFEYVVTQWGIWMAGGVAVPLCMAHPRPELEYVVDDCRADILVAVAETVDRLRPVAAKTGLDLLMVEELLDGKPGPLPDVESDRPAMIVYTSGTTGGPKGVVTTHSNITAQIESLVAAWEWSDNDRILLVLPLHHVHGIINVLGCALWSGACCDIVARFDPVEVWERFVASDSTLFMAVPTIYSKLARAWQEATAERQEEWSRACRKFRLMVSGSAALPMSLFDLWKQISGHTLLERYGMTEIGMALSNPLHGERQPGHVGETLPGVEIRRVDSDGFVVDDGVPGEIEVRGPGVFLEYWDRSEETSASFRGEWFRTGDVAVVEGSSFRILGRQSVDIIKTGGFKVSALEIEETLRDHPAIQECAVVGVPDEEWGERVAVGVVPHRDSDLTLADLRAWAKERLAAYKAPSRLLLLDELPRNPMGKVVKLELRALFEQDQSVSEDLDLK
jgi:malonyl-CoA/methylmalonyl-CoA synthetase